MESRNLEISKPETLTAITSVTSSLALIFMIAFSVTLIILLVFIRYHRNHNSQGTTTIQAPEATYSTIGPPLPPVRIKKHMSYEARIIHTDNHLTAGHDTDGINTLQSQRVLNESAETDYIPVTTSTANMSLPQGGNNVETLTTENVSIIDESEVHVHETNVAVPQALDYGIQTEENVAYNGQFELQDLGPSNKNVMDTQIVANPAYGTIALEVQTQANLALI